MKNMHTDKEIKRFLNDLIGATKVDTDVIEFEYIRSPAEAYVKIKQFFEMDKYTRKRVFGLHSHNNDFKKVCPKCKGELLEITRNENGEYICGKCNVLCKPISKS